MKKVAIISLFCLFSLFIACNLDGVYEHSVDIMKSNWNKNQSVKFEIPVTDTINGHDIYISVRNNNEYPYENLFLFISTRSPKGFVKKDTVEFTLADDKGKWTGHGFGGVWSYDKLFKSDIRFPSSGTYEIEIVQAMRDDVLRGIMDVGVKVERVK